METTTTQTPAAKATRVSAATVQALAIAEAVLQANGGTLHHTRLAELAKPANPGNLDLATKVWNDARTNPESKFLFLKNGIFSLKSATQLDEAALKALVPARKAAAPKPVDPAKAAERVKKLEEALAAAKAALEAASKTA